MTEEEKSIIDEDSGVLSSIQILGALRSSSEATDSQPRAAAANGKQRKRKAESEATEISGSQSAISDKASRIKGNFQRSSSVGGTAIKTEDGETRSATGDKSSQLFVGAEVVFKHSKKQQGIEGEGIQCIIKSISGEGHKKRLVVLFHF